MLKNGYFHSAASSTFWHSFSCFFDLFQSFFTNLCSETSSKILLFQTFQHKMFLRIFAIFCNKNYFSTYVFTQVCPLVPEAELPYWSPRRISLCSCASPSRFACTGNADAPVFALTSNWFELRSDYIVRHFYKRTACFRKSYTDQREQWGSILTLWLQYSSLLFLLVNNFSTSFSITLITSTGF